MTVPPELVTRCLRFGVAGLGRAAASTIPAIVRHPQAELAAAADTRPEALEQFQRRYGGRTYSSVEELCADDAIDAVYIATPTHLHTEHVLIAAGHGKHVIVEKPLAITLDDAARMIDVVDQMGVQMIVGQSQSYEPPIRAMRDLVRSGTLGELRMISGWYFNDWLYRPRLASELDTRLGGGVVFRQGAHHFDIARLIGGGLVRSVRAVTGVWDAERPTEGSYAALLEFESGAAASLVYNGYDHFHTVELTGASEAGTRVDHGARVHASARRALLKARAVGDEAGETAMKRQQSAQAPERQMADLPAQPHFGLIVVSCDRGDIRQTPDSLRVYGDLDQWDVPLPAGVVGRDLMIGELYDAVVKRVPPLHSARWARATLEVSLAVLDSSRTHCEVQLR